MAFIYTKKILLLQDLLILKGAPAGITTTNDNILINANELIYIMDDGLISITHNKQKECAKIILKPLSDHILNKALKCKRIEIQPDSEYIKDMKVELEYLKNKSIAHTLNETEKKKQQELNSFLQHYKLMNEVFIEASIDYDNEIQDAHIVE